MKKRKNFTSIISNKKKQKKKKKKKKKKEEEEEGEKYIISRIPVYSLPCVPFPEISINKNKNETIEVVTCVAIIRS